MPLLRLRAAGDEPKATPHRASVLITVIDQGHLTKHPIGGSPRRFTGSERVAWAPRAEPGLSALRTALPARTRPLRVHASLSGREKRAEPRLSTRYAAPRATRAMASRSRCAWRRERRDEPRSPFTPRCRPGRDGFAFTLRF